MWGLRGRTRALVSMSASLAIARLAQGPFGEEGDLRRCSSSDTLSTPSPTFLSVCHVGEREHEQLAGDKRDAVFLSWPRPIIDIRHKLRP